MASYYTNGFSWYLQWRENGETKKLRYGRVAEVSEAEVKSAAKAKEAELKFGKRILPSRLIFSAFAETYKDWHALEFPDSHYRVAQIIDGHLVPFFGRYPIDAIPVTEAEKYKAVRMKHVSASTVTKELRTLKAVINKAVEWEEIDRNPLRHVAPPRDMADAPPPFFTKEELLKLYIAAPEERAHWWCALANTGLRRSEALHLKKDHVGSDAVRILSDPGARTKSGKWREVPMNQAAAESIKEIRGEDGFVFPRMVPRSLSRHFTNDTQAAGVGGSIHWLRHTYCSHLVMAGVPLRVVQKLAGHSTYRVTENYAHLLPGLLRNEAARISL